MTKLARIVFASCCHDFVEPSITGCIELNRWSQTAEAASHLNRVSVLIMDVASTGDGQTNNKSIQTCAYRTSHVHMSQKRRPALDDIASYHHAASQSLSVPWPDLAKVAV